MSPPILKTLHYIIPAHLPAGMENKLKRAGLYTCEAVHSKVRDGTLRDLPGVGPRWAARITATYTCVEKRKVSPETLEARDQTRRRESFQLNSDEKTLFATRTTPPRHESKKKSLCQEHGHDAETTFSTPSMSRVGRRCTRCPHTWVEDWSKK
jgi:hypothetical protein